MGGERGSRPCRSAASEMGQGVTLRSKLCPQALREAARDWELRSERETEAASRVMERADRALLTAYALRLGAYAVERGGTAADVVALLRGAEIPDPEGQEWSLERFARARRST